MFDAVLSADVCLSPWRPNRWSWRCSSSCFIFRNSRALNTAQNATALRVSPFSSVFCTPEQSYLPQFILGVMPSVQVRNLSLNVDNCICGVIWFWYLEMLSGVTQEETCVHFVNLATEISVAEMSQLRIEQSCVFLFELALKATVTGKVSTLSSVVKYSFRLIAIILLREGSTWFTVLACVPCSACSLIVHYVLVLSDIVAIQQHCWLRESDPPSRPANATVRFHPFSPVKNTRAFEILL